MTTYKRICIKSDTITAANGDTASIERGLEYITSGVRQDEDGPYVVVYSGAKWGAFSIGCFASDSVTRFT